MSDAREKIAEKEHEQWAHWTTYFLCNATKENLLRWQDQCLKPYSELSDLEKDSDRKWADIILSLPSLESHYLSKPSGLKGDNDRDIPIGEAVEILKSLLYAGNSCEEGLLLKSGERVTVKEPPTSSAIPTD